MDNSQDDSGHNFSLRLVEKNEKYPSMMDRMTKACKSSRPDKLFIELNNVNTRDMRLFCSHLFTKDGSLLHMVAAGSRSPEHRRRVSYCLEYVLSDNDKDSLLMRYQFPMFSLSAREGWNVPIVFFMWHRQRPTKRHVIWARSAPRADQMKRECSWRICEK